MKVQNIKAPVYVNVADTPKVNGVVIEKEKTYQVIVGKPSGGSTIVTDETLSKQGRSADAYVVGKKLEALNERMENLEEEVGDASLLLSLI